MFKSLAQKLNIPSADKSSDCNASVAHVSCPVDKLQNKTYNSVLKSMSEHALKLYEHKTDVKNFTNLVLSNPENTSHNNLVNQLFQNGEKDPFEDIAIFELSENESFLKDLGYKD